MARGAASAASAPPILCVAAIAAAIGAAAAPSAFAASAAPVAVVSPTGSDSARCSRSAPCATLQRALQRAGGGGVVEMRPGSYPPQVIRADATPRRRVLITPARPGVVLGYLDIAASRLEVRAVATHGWEIRPGAADVTLRGVRSTGAGTFITSANDVRVIGGSITGADSVDGLQVKAAEGRPEPTGLLIDGLTISRVTRNERPDAHTECVQFTAGRRVVIRNSAFLDCSTQGVFFKEGLGGQIDGVIVENSWFGRLEGFNTLIFDDGVSNMVARYNFFAQAPRLGGGVGTSGLRAFGNAGELSSCGSGVDYRQNFWTATRCGPGDRQGPAPFPTSDVRPPRWLVARAVRLGEGGEGVVRPRVARPKPVLFLVRGHGRPLLVARDPSGRERGVGRSGPGYAFLRVARPNAGRWTLRVRDRSTAGRSGPVFVTASQ